jgi:hypothetical protein
VKPQNAILFASAILFAVSRWVPGGGWVLYPLTLFVTWVHEMGHGLTALVVGGSFVKLQIFWNSSGLAYTNVQPGLAQAAVSAGGLLGPPLFGAIVLGLVHGPKRARLFLLTLSLAMLLSLAIWVRSVTGVVVVPLVALLFAWLGWRGFAESPHYRVIASQILAVVAAVDTLTRMVSYVFTKEVEVDGKVRLSDISKFSQNAGGLGYVLWGVVFTGVACGLLALGLWLARRASNTGGNVSQSRPTVVR